LRVRCAGAAFGAETPGVAIAFGVAADADDVAVVAVAPSAGGVPGIDFSPMPPGVFDDPPPAGAVVV